MHPEFTEMYLKTLYILARGSEPVRTTEIARSMDISPSSVTEMLQRLSEKGFIEYEKYRGVTLTEEGLKIATRVSRKHRLAEQFLSELLGMQGARDRALVLNVRPNLCMALDYFGTALTQPSQ